jgi:predicted O-methyltransferase YrrM
MQFTQDWFSVHIPNWEKWVAPLKGQPIKALEIGSYEGRSALWLLGNVLTHPDSHLDCVDPFSYDAAPKDARRLDGMQAVKDRFLKNTAKYRNKKRCKHFETHSLEFLQWYTDNRYDLIYIDGCHHPISVIQDLVLSWELLNKNGVMIMDDREWKHAPKTPKVSIEAFLSIYTDNYELLHRGYQVAIRKTV